MPSNLQQVIKDNNPYQIQEAIVAAYDIRDPRSCAIRVSGGRVIRRCTGATGNLFVGAKVLVVMNRSQNAAVVVGTIQDSDSLAAGGGTIVTLNPPANLAVTPFVKQLAAHWDFFPGNSSLCYQVQHNASAAEDGNEVSVLVTKGSYYLYSGATGATRYFRVRALQWLSSNNLLYSAWSVWVSGTLGALVNGDLPVVDIAHGGTGQTTAEAALNALLPDQTGQDGNSLHTASGVPYWAPDGGGGGGGTVIVTTLPVGALIGVAGSSLPQGYLWCDGTAYSRTTYAELFAAIGTTYGSGDGSTTFNIPDFRGRFMLGAGTGTGLTNRVRGATGGEETHVLTTGEMPAHTHAINQYGSGDYPGTGDLTFGLIDVDPGADNNTGSAGSDGAHNTMPPFLVTNIAIKYTSSTVGDVIFDDSVDPESVGLVADPGGDDFAARRDHIHDLDETISPNWTGAHHHSQPVYVESDASASFVSELHLDSPSFSAPAFSGFRSQGTEASPMTVDDGTVLGRFSGRGFDGGGYPTGPSGAVEVVASETHTSTDKGTRVEISTTPNGSDTRAVRVTIEEDGTLEATIGLRLPAGPPAVGDVWTATDTAGNGEWAPPAGGTDAAAIHDNVADEIHAVAEKTTPVSADVLLLEDSADSWAKKRVQIGNLPTGGGGGATIHESAYGSPPGSPTDGDDWHVSDGGMVAHRASSAWHYYGPLYPLTLPPASGSWTALNLGSNAAGDWTRGVIDFTCTNSGSDNLRGYYRSYPSPVKVVCAFSLLAQAGTYIQFGLFVRNSGDSKCRSFGVRLGNSILAAYTNWNSATSWASDAGSMSVAQVNIGSLIWLKYEEDSTNRIVSMSINGVSWFDLLTEDKTTFVTGDQIGFMAYVAGGTNSVLNHLTIYSWEEG